MYKPAVRFLEHKFDQPQVVVTANSDELNSFSPLKMQNSGNIINNSVCISNLVGDFKKLSYDWDLESAAILNIALQKVQPKKESWLLFTVKKIWVKPSLLDSKDWLMEEAEEHHLLKNAACKTRNEDTTNPLTRAKVAPKEFDANTQQKGHQKSQQGSSTKLTSS